MAEPPPLDTAALGGIVFDLDGTLIDSYAAITASLNAARAAFGLAELAEREVRGLVGHGLEALIEGQLGAERVREGVRIFRERYAALGVRDSVVLPGVGRGLARLAARGLRLAVASNKPARFSEPILAALGLREYLDHVAGPDSVGSTKPDPAMLRACFDALGVTAAEALYVGDMVLDVETAARAGVAVALVATGSASVAELRATGHLVLASFEELVAALGAG